MAILFFSVLQKKQAVVITIDDFHNFCTKKKVTSHALNQVVHMSSAIIDAPGLPATKLPPVDDIHRIAEVVVAGDKIKVRGGMSAEAILSTFTEELPQFYNKTLLQHLPIEFRDLDIGNMQQSIINLR